MPFHETDNLKLTDFMDLPTLQEIQDSFAAVANVKASITDAEGHLLTSPTPTRDFLRRQRAIAASTEVGSPQLVVGSGDMVVGSGDIATTNPQLPTTNSPPRREYVAPITVANQRLGTIRMTADDGSPAAIQFLFLLANAIARLCFQEYQLRRRIDELTAVYDVASMLTEARDLPRVLQRTVELVCDVMGAKASSIRLADPEKDELVIKAVHNLSSEYLNKGAIRLSTAEIDREALSPRGYCYVRDMASDQRVAYREEAIREGIASMLSVGMRYKGRQIGVLRVYTSQEKHFSQFEIDLLRAVAAQAAAAIENARLLQESLAAEALEKQVAMAVDVQQRMVPQEPPKVPGVDIATSYVPCFELGGDLYDFMPLPGNNLGLVVADVSGKGVPASLIMASVRASIRAYVDNLYYLYEVMRRVNVMLCRDTKPDEFVTLFYGVLDTETRRLTYCNAGHPPPLLLRDGEVTELDSRNLVLGLDPHESYEQVLLDLKPGDVLLLYTDGLTDALNFQRQTYGKARLIEAFRRAAAVSEVGSPQLVVGSEDSGSASNYQLPTTNSPPATAEMIAESILWDMRRYVGLTQRNDDVTMIVVRVLAPD